jgi:AcrR family transcriptional regulator
MNFLPMDGNRVRASHSYNPQQTRSAILTAAFEEIHRLGFQAASLNDILARTGVTKGALYHHFPTKKALGLAVVDEVIGAYLRDKWLVEAQPGENAIDALIAMFTRAAESAQSASSDLGCPFYNLAQEMSAVDDDFRRHLAALFDGWRTLFADVVRGGQARGEVRADVRPEQVAVFLITAVEGAIATVKMTRNPALLSDCLASLTQYLDSLRTREP